MIVDSGIVKAGSSEHQKSAECQVVRSQRHIYLFFHADKLIFICLIEFIIGLRAVSKPIQFKIVNDALNGCGLDKGFILRTVIDGANGKQRPFCKAI